MQSRGRREPRGRFGRHRSRECVRPHGRRRIARTMFATVGRARRAARRTIAALDLVSCERILSLARCSLLLLPAVVRRNARRRHATSRRSPSADATAAGRADRRRSSSLCARWPLPAAASQRRPVVIVGRNARRSSITAASATATLRIEGPRSASRRRSCMQSTDAIRANTIGTLCVFVQGFLRRQLLRAALRVERHTSRAIRVAYAGTGSQA